MASSSASPPDPLPAHIYKILDPIPDVLATSHASPGGTALPSDVTLPSTPLDQSDGFIHLSTRPQVRFVLGKFYGEVDEVVLVKISYVRLSEHARHADAVEIKWEDAGISTFPHVYGGDITGRVVEGWRVLRRDKEVGWERELGRIDGEGWFVD